MKDDRPENNSTFERLMQWAKAEDPSLLQEEPVDPDHAELVAYLEYLKKNESVSFEEYRRETSGEKSEHGHGAEEPAAPARKKHRKPGTLRRAIRVYRVLAVLIVAALMCALIATVLYMPAFGDPDSPMINSVVDRYIDKGVEETGAVNLVAGMILDYRAFDTFGESTVLFAAAMSTVLLMRRSKRACGHVARETDFILNRMGRIILPAVFVYGIYVVLNGHISPGGGFSGGTVLGCGFILGALLLGEERMNDILTPDRLTKLTVGCLLAYGAMKGYSFFTGANHVGWEIPKGTPGDIISAGFILPLNICVGIIVACTMYTFYTLFVQKEE
ncbi:MAG: MnhB domain-containing protein [Eubacteriales bacterium]|nr:MnhB domain-containing protein [Eubacteriales bacterium]